MILTEENYHSPEANLAYYSGSQLTSFMECEAKTMAELRGEWSEPDSTALLVGSYVDAHFSKTLALFRSQHPEIYTRTGSLRSEFSKAEEIIARLERDPMAMMMLDSMNQVILTGTLAGYPFKAKLDILLDTNLCDAISAKYPEMDDLLFQHNAIVDLKVMRDFEPKYKEESGRVSFIEFWNYDLKMAIYQRLVLDRDGTTPPCFILAATKEPITDIGLFKIGQTQLNTAFTLGMELMPHLAEVKSGKVEPNRCEKCGYCKSTKVLTKGIYLGEW
jgi:hypothetical protein